MVSINTYRGTNVHEQSHTGSPSCCKVSSDMGAKQRMQACTCVSNFKCTHVHMSAPPSTCNHAGGVKEPPQDMGVVCMWNLHMINQISWATSTSLTAAHHASVRPKLRTHQWPAPAPAQNTICCASVNPRPVSAGSHANLIMGGGPHMRVMQPSAGPARCAVMRSALMKPVL